LEDDLVEGYCPECYEADGLKRTDFETVEAAGGGKTRYRCEKCNIIIEYSNLMEKR
jgi:transposase-like protein